MVGAEAASRGQWEDERKSQCLLKIAYRSLYSGALLDVDGAKVRSSSSLQATLSVQ